jgi:hypothetical protein
MTMKERHKYVAESCKLMSLVLLLGQEFSINDLSWNQQDLIYGVCESLELRWWNEPVDVTAGGEIALVTDLINEMQQEQEEAQSEGDERKERLRLMKQAEQHAIGENKERLRLKK